jgi:hypothetical protein
MANKIQLRRDTTANWTSNNPILASGEIGIETDSTPQRLKIGNGADDWNTLPYYSTSDLASVVGGVNITVDNSDPENPVINLDTLNASDVGLGNVPNVDATDRSNHTGTQSVTTINNFNAEVSSNPDVSANTAKRSYPIADENKLSGIEDNATADQTGAEIVLAIDSELGNTDWQDGGGVTDHSALNLDDGTNPHGTTANDVGLGNVDNTSDADKPVSTATQTALDGKADSVHTHTKSDITDFNDGDYATAAQGATADSAIQPGDIDTLAELNGIITDATLIDTNDSRLSDDRNPNPHTHTASEITDFDVEVSNNADVSANTTHRGLTNNPHSVTAAQVGLGNVDNTSDADKPVSTATQTALDGKVDDAQVLTNVPAGAVFTDTQRTDEEIEDVVGAQFNHANHTNITAVYDDISGEVRLTGSVGGAGGQVDSVVGGTGITVDATDPVNPIINRDALTKTDITDFSDGDYATAAQGATADSAIQPGDIDTLSELNGILTDATLIDTADPRLSDNRDPNPHTHTLSEITDAGTSAGLDVAAAGDAAVGEVVKGDDTRLTDSRTPLAHTHTASEITDFDTEVANNTDVSTNTTHRGLTNNPHSVTAAQVGLGAVPNIDATDRANHTGTQTASTISDFDTEVSNNTTVQSAFTTANNNVTTINNLSSDDIGNDSGVFAPTVTGALDSLSSAIGSTVSADGSVTTHNDVTDAGSGQIITGVERTKLDGIEAGAEVNVNADWNAVGGDAEILNKPNIPDSSDDISNDSSVVGVTVTDAIDNLNSGKLDGVAGGTDISIDATDPLNPIINFTGASGGASDTIDVTQTGHGFSAGMY